MWSRKSRRMCRYCLYFKPAQALPGAAKVTHNATLPTCEVDVIRQLVDRPRSILLIGMTDRRCQDFWPADLPRTPFMSPTDVQS